MTCNDHHMWLIPFTEGGKHVLRVDLGKPRPIAGVRACAGWLGAVSRPRCGRPTGVWLQAPSNELMAERVLRAACGVQIRVWNYNKSAEDVSRGVRSMRLHLDGVGVDEVRCRRG